MIAPKQLPSLRLPLAGLLMLTLLWAGFTVHSHWEAFIQWCLAAQITLHRYLVMYLLQLNNHQYTGGLWLLTGAFFYGVLHAIGPGHGKFIVTTWLSTTKESLLAARVVPFIGSLMQGVSAILFVFILAIGFNLAAGDLSTSRWYVEKISAVLIGAFGLFIIYQALKTLRPKPIFSRFSQPHSHDEHCGCGHHGVGAELTDGNWKTRLGVILATGARPCSGAIMILLFSNALGIVSWGIAAVMTMSFGTALSIMGLSLAVRYARNQTQVLFAGNHSPLRWLGPVIRIIGGLALVLFALILFLTVIPISANGDYIAAGC
ncbi:nickel/cobalt transporter [Citrobacter koseri]|uniref:nickel/cobalt transporter n=1 Tax=Citrobacter koseri TaxID=545 RepID=UPI0038920974